MSVTVPTTARMLMERSRDGLIQAAGARTAGERYVAAHLAAIRAAAVVVTVRAMPHRRFGSVWETLPKIAPEMATWAGRFAGTAPQRAAITAGRGGVVTAQEANDLLRDAEAFHHLVEASLGLPFQQVLPGTLAPVEVTP